MIPDIKGARRSRVAHLRAGEGAVAGATLLSLLSTSPRFVYFQAGLSVLEPVDVPRHVALRIPTNDSLYRTAPESASGAAPFFACTMRAGRRLPAPADGGR